MYRKGDKVWIEMEIEYDDQRYARTHYGMFGESVIKHIPAPRPIEVGCTIEAKDKIGHCPLEVHFIKGDYLCVSAPNSGKPVIVNKNDFERIN